MRTGRLEAFSDGVLAVAITIMVLELEAPDGFTFADLWHSSGLGFLTNVLSFVYLGIYWNNHHHLFQLVDRVDGLVLWANLHLLFWLVLLPFSTEWMARSGLEVAPTVLYAVNLLLAALAYWLLELAIRHVPGDGDTLGEVVGLDRKALASMGGYGLAIVVAPWNTTVSLVLLVGVALLWLVPDRRIERRVSAGG